MRDAAGFITLEIMLAIALVGTALAAAFSVERGSAYWIMSARAAEDDLQTAAALMENAITASATDFFHLTSTLAQDSARAVIEASRCAKSVEVSALRRFPGYPTRATSLPFFVTDPIEMHALGGDCGLSVPAGNWSMPSPASDADLGNGNPTGIDVLDGVTYAVADAPPYLRIITTHGVVDFSNGFTGAGPYAAIDVARDFATGRAYAYVAAVTPQLQIIDVTDMYAPVEVSSANLAGVALKGAQAGAWRVSVYGGFAYVATRYMIASNPELHVFDVGDPTAPHEIGGGYKASTSIYGMIVHDQSVPGTQGIHRRLLYLATTSSTAEIKVLDVTAPASITTVTSCDLPGSYQATALALLGTTLYAGRENVPSGGEDLYAFDVSDPTAATFCTPIAKTDIGTDGYSRHVEALSASGPYLFVATTNTTNAHGQIQVRSANPASALALLGTFSIPGLAENALDFENDTLYAASTASPQLQALTAP